MRIALATGVLLAWLLTPVSSFAQCLDCGDVDCDGGVTVKDAFIVLRATRRI